MPSPVDIIMADKPSALNKKLIRYFNNSLFTLNKINLKFNFVLVKTTDKKFMRDNDIESFPTIIHNHIKKTGANTIIDHLNKYHSTFQKKTALRTPDDDVADYLNKVLSEGDENESKEDLSAQVVEESSRRKGITKKKSAISKKQTMVNNKSYSATSGRTSTVDTGDPVSCIKHFGATDNKTDDDLMIKFFENQQETQL
jgi:DNA-binding phage protein